MAFGRFVDYAAARAQDSSLSGAESLLAQEGAAIKRVLVSQVLDAAKQSGGIIGNQLFATDAAEDAVAVLVNAYMQGFLAAENAAAARSVLGSQQTSAILDAIATLAPVTGNLRINSDGTAAIDETAYLSEAELSAYAQRSYVDAKLAEMLDAIRAEFLSVTDAEQRFILADEMGLIRTDVYGTNFTADGSFWPYFGSALNGGTVLGSGTVVAVPGHPGILQMRSGTSTGGGWRISTGVASVSFRGGEWFESIFRIESVSGETHFIGFHDSTGGSDPTDAIVLKIVDNAASCMTAKASTRTTVSTGLTISTSIWYRVDIQYAQDKTWARFEIYNDDTGALLFATTMTTNLPNTGEAASVGFLSTSTDTTGTKILTSLDKMRHKI